MKKYWKIALVIVALLVLVGIIWYRTPIEKEETMTMCSTEGETIKVTFDVAWHRYLFAPTQLKGTITIDGVVYELWKTAHQKSFIDNIKDKISNVRYIPMFVLESETDALEYSYNFIDIWMDENSDLENFKKSYILLNRDGVSEHFFGPANTKEEAQQIRQDISSMN